MERRNALLKQHEEATTVNAAANGDHNGQFYDATEVPSRETTTPSCLTLRNADIRSTWTTDGNSAEYAH